MSTLLAESRLFFGLDTPERVHRVPKDQTCAGWIYDTEAHLRDVIYELKQENFQLREQVEKLLAHSKT